MLERIAKHVNMAQCQRGLYDSENDVVDDDKEHQSDLISLLQNMELCARDRLTRLVNLCVIYPFMIYRSF